MEDQGSQLRSEEIYAKKIDRCLRNFGIKFVGCTGGGLLISLLMKGKSWPLVFGVAFGSGLGISNCNYEFFYKLPNTKYPEYSSFKTDAAVDDSTSSMSFFDYIMKGQYKVTDNLTAEKELDVPLPSWEEKKSVQNNLDMQPQPYTQQNMDMPYTHWGNEHWFPEQPYQPVSKPPQSYVRDEYGRPQPSWNRNN